MSHCCISRKVDATRRWRRGDQDIGSADLDLLNGEVKEGELVADGDERLCPSAAHARPEAAVQLQHDQLVEHHADLFLIGGDRQLVVRLDLLPAISKRKQTKR